MVGNLACRRTQNLEISYSHATRFPEMISVYFIIDICGEKIVIWYLLIIDNKENGFGNRMECRDFPIV